MPIVPRQTDPRVTRSALPGVRASVGSFASDAPPLDLSPVVNLAAKIYEDQRQQADQVAVLEADNALSDLSTRLLYDKDGGVMQARGKAALDASDGLRDTWDKEVGTIATRMKGTRQRQAFEQRAVQRWANINEATERHVGAEMRRYDDETTKAALTNRLNDALTNYADPAAVTVAITETRALLTDAARRAGQPKEWLEGATADHISEIHTGVLTRMLTAGKDLSAKAYYAQHGAEVVGKDKAVMEKAMEEGSADGEAFRFATDVFAKTPDLTRTGARDAVAGIEDSTVRAKALASLNASIAAREADEQDAGEALFNEAHLTVEQTGRKPSSVIWSQLTPGQRNSLTGMLEQKTSGGAPVTDQTVWHTLMQQASDSPQAFAKFNLLQYRHKLSASDFQELTRIQIRLGKGETDDTALLGYRTVTTLVNQNLAPLFPNANKKTIAGRAEADKLLELRTAIDEDIENWKETTGKGKIGRDDAQRIVEHHTLRVFVERGFKGDKEVFATDLEQDQRGSTYIPLAKIDTSELEGTRRVFAAAGKAPTERQIERAAAATMLGDVALLRSIISEAPPIVLGARK